jgi:hypothetical protein
MSRGWILEKINQLENKGQSKLAKRLRDAAADGKLKGMVVTTPTSGANAFHPLVELKDWSQIGADKW